MDKTIDLINAVKANQPRAYEQLLNDFQNMIYKIIHSFKLDYGAFCIDQQDLFTEGCLALRSAAMDFDPDKGAQFSTFAYHVIKAKISTYVRTNAKKLLRESTSLDSMENCDYYENLAVCDSATLYHREKEFTYIINQFLLLLSKNDRLILELYQQEYDYKQIASKLNVNKKYVDNHLTMIRRKMRQFLKQIEYFPQVKSPIATYDFSFSLEERI